MRDWKTYIFIFLRLFLFHNFHLIILFHSLILSHTHFLSPAPSVRSLPVANRNALHLMCLLMNAIGCNRHLTGSTLGVCVCVREEERKMYFNMCVSRRKNVLL